jgi:DnaK suppressor protein
MGGGDLRLTTDQPKETSLMYCPLDGTTLVAASRRDVEIDYCPDCFGVWLDRGELDDVTVADTDEQITEALTRDTDSLRAALLAKAEELRSMVRQQTAALEKLDADREARHHASLARVQALDEVVAIERALRRLDDGTYGTCEGCGNAIPLARLDALPSVAHCVRCAVGARRMR